MEAKGLHIHTNSLTLSGRLRSPNTSLNFFKYGLGIECAGQQWRSFILVFFSKKVLSCI